MAHYAELDVHNIVLRVIGGPDEDVDNAESLLFSETGKVWRRTSYNTFGGKHSTGGVPFRKNYAGIGYKYDEQRDAFIPPKPAFNSWVLNEDTCLWEPPIPMPTDGFHYEWDELNQVWEQLTE